jgi:ferredoxin/flavodoxin---NADP+ reductase
VNKGDIAIVGAGPAGLFLALELRKRMPEAGIDLFDKRGEPFGLVRYGVAPDHQHTRRVMKVMAGPLADPGVTFHGGVLVDGPRLAELRADYRAVALCIGAEIPRFLELPGRDGTANIFTGLAFATWINGESLADPPQLEGETAVVIGNGNVALDIARLLARPVDVLALTDISPEALEVLAASRLRHIVVMGRRGPVQASFGDAELREIAESDGWNTVVNPEDLLLSGSDQDVLLKSADEREGLVMEAFHAMVSKPVESSRPTIEFRFRCKPVGYERTGEDRVNGVNLDTGETLPCSLVVEAVGQRTEVIPGLPYDTLRGVIPNQNSRVEGCPGVYVCGWAGRGAKGLIGHNRRDAMGTSSAILEDWPQLRS